MYVYQLKKKKQAGLMLKGNSAWVALKSKTKNVSTKRSMQPYTHNMCWRLTVMHRLNYAVMKLTCWIKWIAIDKGSFAVTLVVDKWMIFFFFFFFLRWKISSQYSCNVSTWCQKPGSLNLTLHQLQLNSYMLLTYWKTVRGNLHQFSLNLKVNMWILWNSRIQQTV